TLRTLRMRSPSRPRRRQASPAVRGIARAPPSTCRSKECAIASDTPSLLRSTRSRLGHWGRRRMQDPDITRMLALARDGDQAQMAAVFEALYPDLLRLAGSRMRGHQENTFTPTVLVHELFLRLTRGAPMSL